MVRYTRLWETMEKRGMSQYRLIRYHGISAGQMRRLKLNMNVSTQTIERLCRALECRVEDCLLYTSGCGQFSVNISKPGVTKGQHWHNSKWEFFMVVSGHGLIQERKIGTDEIREFEVSGEQIQAVHMLPGYTHNIINLSQTDDLVTVMWANEAFDPEHPDTFYEVV